MCMQNATLAKKIAEYNDYKSKIDALEFKVNEIKEELKKDLASREVEKYEFEVDGVKHTISNTTYTRETLDTKKFKEDHPKLWEQYKKVNPQSRFDIK